MAELLLELLSEELPARMQAQAAEALGRLVGEALEGAGLKDSRIETHAGPRRLTLVADGLPFRTEDVTEEKRGPRLGSPEAAMAGFLGSTGAAPEARGALLEAVSAGREYAVGGAVFFPLAAGKAQHLGVRLTRPGRATADVVAEAVPGVLRRMPWPKSMRWAGPGSLVWARPLRRLLCLLDGAVVPFALEEGGLGLASGDLTEGHRFLAPGTIRVTGFADYRARLAEASVVLDQAERARRILEGAQALAAGAGVELVPDEGLLAEVAGLVEAPFPLLGRIDGAYMDLPAEVLRTSMRVNQRYFATRHADGRAAPFFVVVANVPGRDGGAAIVAGNERVLRARLSDARFFWDQDRRVGLEAMLPKLAGTVFHARLGTQAQRVGRLRYLAVDIAAALGADTALAERAARLAKADLASGMVGEFPELQGVMGGHYARTSSEPGEVAEAIATHYAPRGAGEKVPEGPIAVAVALADKLDQLAGFFAIDERPTGSGDPYALRRAGLGVIRIIRENALRLPLAPLVRTAAIKACLSVYTTARIEAEAARREFEARYHLNIEAPDLRIETNSAAVSSDLLAFLLDRLRVQLRSEGARHDVIDAVAGSFGDGDLLRLLARADALAALLASPDGPNLQAAFTRAANILRIEAKKDGLDAYPPTPDPSLYVEPAERDLASALDQAIPTVERALAAEDFAAAMTALAATRPHLDRFFDQVTVNAEDTALRTNRLRLLARITHAFGQIADFARLEG